MWKLLIMAVVSALSAIAAYSILRHPLSRYYKFFGYLGLGLFGLGPIIFIVRLLILRPVLTTSADGIRIEQTFFRSPTYDWEDIAAICVRKQTNNAIVRLINQQDFVIILGDTVEIAERTNPNDATNPNWRRALRATMLGSVSLAWLYLPMKAGDLVRLIAQRNTSEIARYGIVVRDTPEPTTKRKRR